MQHRDAGDGERVLECAEAVIFDEAALACFHFITDCNAQADAPATDCDQKNSGIAANLRVAGNYLVTISSVRGLSPNLLQALTAKVFGPFFNPLTVNAGSRAVPIFFQ